LRVSELSLGKGISLKIGVIINDPERIGGKQALMSQDDDVSLKIFCSK
jgi:hypothetical protein